MRGEGGLRHDMGGSKGQAKSKISYDNGCKEVKKKIHTKSGKVFSSLFQELF